MIERGLRGEQYGYFAPTYKLLSEVFDRLRSRAAPIVASSNKNEGMVRFITNGGSVEFWTLEDPDAGRSRRYHKVGIDEAGLVRDLASRWYDAILPTLADFDGDADLRGTPKGKNFFHTAYSWGLDPHEPDWESFHEPSTANPYLPAGIIEEFRRKMPDRSFRQEFLAEFLDDAGGVFQGVRDCVVAGRTSLANPKGPICFGLDLAKTQDFTVLTGLDADGDQCALDRWQKLSWDATVNRVVRAVEPHQRSILTVDSTGVGDPIYEALRKALPTHRIEGYKFTHESKERLVENLQMQFERGGIRLYDDPTQLAECQAYEYRLSRSGTVTTSAPEGMHDDIPTSLMLAAWPFRPAAPKRKFLAA